LKKKNRKIKIQKKTYLMNFTRISKIKSDKTNPSILEKAVNLVMMTTTTRKADGKDIKKTL
jgi:hypothetical protein